MNGKRRAIWAAALAVAVSVAACGGGDAESTTTTTTTASFTRDEESFLTALGGALDGTDLGDVEAVELGRDLCRALRLMEAAAVPGASAADAIRLVELSALTGAELALYGAVLAVAPNTLCPDVVFYGADVAYWLGI